MMIKGNLIIFVLTLFILMVNNVSYADISIDDMGFLIEDEVGNAEENEETIDNKETQDVKVINVEEKVNGSSKQNVKFYLNEASDILHNNIVIVIAVGVCSLLFVIILYIFYVKIKNLSEQAQVSKDLAEKYFYNIREYLDENGKIDNINIEDLKVSDIDTEISDIITSVEKVFDEKEKEAVITDSKSGKADDGIGGLGLGDIVKGGEQVGDVDDKEKVVDHEKPDDEVNAAEALIPEKQPETNSGEEVGTPGAVEDISQKDYIKEALGSVAKKSRKDARKDVGNSGDVKASGYEVDVDKKDKVDGMEKVVDQEKPDGGDAEATITEKQPEIKEPETNSGDKVDDIPPETAEGSEVVNDIKEALDDPNKEKKEDEPDVLESLQAVEKSDDNKVSESETPLKEKEEDLPASDEIEGIDDIGIDIDDILKMETEDKEKDNKE